MGILTVQLIMPIGGSIDDGQLTQVKYLSPFLGSTSAKYLNPNKSGSDITQDYDGTQKSYGMWMVPPDPGNLVLCMFVNCELGQGYWLGCVADENMNFMVPGLAATKYHYDTTDATNPITNDTARLPTAEYNKAFPENNTPTDPTQLNKPTHPSRDFLKSQGLLFDDTRGITTSSARREVPSAVYGISTPGPIDVAGPVGEVGSTQKGRTIPVSRLGGSTFVMDDGDDQFLRKTPANEGPPKYASVEQGETDGDATIPHNELFRIRTRTGHQILLHNSEDLIYITNSRGTAWVELSSNGKIDIYAEDSISIHTGNDLNLYANRDINMEAGRNFNLKVAKRHQTEVGTNKVLIVTANNTIEVKGTHDETITGATKLTAKGGFNLNTTGANNFTASAATNIKSGGNHVETAAQIHMNGPAATAAATAAAPKALTTFKNPTEIKGGSITSIMLRVPTTEPYPGHENLDPAQFTPKKTDREAGSASTVPEMWQAYTTVTDTFEKVSTITTPQNEQE
jgi:uncharacterized protein (DUF2345 family)